MSKNFQAILGTSAFLCTGGESLKANALRDLETCSRLPITCLRQSWKELWNCQQIFKEAEGPRY